MCTLYTHDMESFPLTIVRNDSESQNYTLKSRAR